MMIDLQAVRWRVGRSIGRTIYAIIDESHDVLIGLMDTIELAAAVVRAHNIEISANDFFGTDLRSELD